MIIKKLLALLLSSSMAFSPIASVCTASAAEGDDFKLVSLDFNDEGNRLGTAAEKGTLNYKTGKNGTSAAYFDGTGSGYIQLPNVLAGKDSLTFTFSSLAEAAPCWWLFAAPNDNVQDYLQEKYFGFFDQYNRFTAERYKNTGSRPPVPSSDYTADEWKDIVVSVNANTVEMYINGNFAGAQKYDYSLNDILGSNPIAYIGKANWGGGEYAKGYIDDFVVYDYDIIPDLGDISAVESDLVLPSSGKGYTVTWKSSDTSIISDTGKVTRPEKGRRKVTLTAEISFDTHKVNRIYEVYVSGIDYYDFSLDVTAEKGVDIQDNMYGLFFEDINYSADGGLYAEMIENRSFEAKKYTKGTAAEDCLYGWSAYPSNAGGALLSLKSTGGLNENNPHYLEFTPSKNQKGIKNQAYDGVYTESGKTYNVSLFAKADSYSGNVTAAVYKDGTLKSKTVIADSLTNEWKKYEAKITMDETVRNGDFVIELDGEGTVMLDMVSCIPEDAVLGVFRRDLAEKLKALNPGFLRFPGGCIIEGYNLDNRYNWKDSVGAVEERKQNWSRWAAHTNVGIDNGFKHYNQTYGIGYFEYFRLCEYLDCDPVPVVNVGMACEYQTKETVPVFKADGKTYTEEFYSYIQDALDLIEFANGSKDTKWGAVRSAMGHPEPFGLTMMGIGNEQWYIEGNQWYERYEAFEKEIHSKYPDMKLISTSGPLAGGGLFDDAWNWIRKNDKENNSFTYAVDEHYYVSPEWFLANDSRYDNYDRTTQVFAGEYASHTTLTGDFEKRNNLESAIAEAAFMTGLERNADVVYMASYAPLLARLNYTQWAPDMIWFDDASSYVTPNYHVQSMYMNNNGDYTLKSTVSDSFDKVYQSVSFDKSSGDVIIKLANPYAQEKTCAVSINSEFELTGKADIIVLKGENLTDANSIDEPNKISPERTVSDISSESRYTMPPHSFTVMRVHTENTAVRIIDANVKNGVFSFELEADDMSGSDIFAALYDANGTLSRVWINSLSGSAEEVNTNGVCEFKVMVWNKSYTPVVDMQKKKVIAAE